MVRQSTPTWNFPAGAVVPIPTPPSGWIMKIDSNGSAGSSGSKPSPPIPTSNLPAG